MVLFGEGTRNLSLIIDWNDTIVASKRVVAIPTHGSLHGLKEHLVNFR